MLEAGTDVYLPMARKQAAVEAESVRYIIDLSDGFDVKSLRGKNCD